MSFLRYDVIDLNVDVSFTSTNGVVVNVNGYRESPLHLYGMNRRGQIRPVDDGVSARGCRHPLVP